MDLSRKYRHFVSQSLVLLFAFILTACAAMPENQTESSTPTSNDEASVSEQSELSGELVYYILTAEIAGQRGDINTAVELYNRAAQAVDSPAVSRRSTQVASYTRDPERINRSIDRWLAVDPNDAEVYLMQTPFLMLKDDYDGVIKALDKALALDPENAPQILAQASDNLRDIATQEQALSVLQSLQLYKDNDVDAIFAYGRMAAYFQQYDQALLAADRVLAQQESHEEALILKADVLQRQGKGASALLVLRHEANKGNASNELKFAYAKLLGENNKTAQSRAIFEQLHRNLPENEEIIFALGLLALEDNNGVTAKQYFNQLILLGDKGKQAGYFMGLAEVVNKNVDTALIWFASVPIDSPRYAAAQEQYVNLLVQNGDLDKAQMHFKLLRKENPNKAQQYYLFEASFLRQQGQDQAAFDLYTEALKEFPSSIDLLYSRGMVSEPLNKLTVLESDFRKILKIEPNNAAALNALGYTLTDRMGRHQEALVLIQKAVALDPQDAFYLDSLGWVYYRLGDLDKAALYLNKAVAINPDPELLAHLGEVLWQQGYHAEAKKIWQQGLKQDPNNQSIQKTMRRLK